ncbi:MAG TPA: RNA polymerase sigma factor [Phycisphaerae bacterium]|nr:RNA polymerase sigma factor [Phycisphaerae bacterium]
MACGTDQGDRELIAAAQMGERSALDELVRRHDRWVRNVVYATTANASAIDDIVQGVWIKVWQQIGTLMEPSRWRAWLYRLAKNAAIDAGQKVAGERRSRLAFMRSRQGRASVPQPATTLMEEEQRRRVLAAIRGLPAIYREPFILRHLEDWSYAEIGEAMSLPVDTVETRLVRARRLLRAALQDSDTEQKAHAR